MIEDWRNKWEAFKKKREKELEQRRDEKTRKRKELAQKGKELAQKRKEAAQKRREVRQKRREEGQKKWEARQKNVETSLAEMKQEFVALFERGEVDQVQIRLSFIKLIFTQVPFSRVVRTAVSTLKTDIELQKSPPEVFYDFLVNYVQTFVEDLENIRIMVHHSIEKIKKEVDKRKT